MKKIPPIIFIALGLFGVYCIEFGVVGILPMIMSRFSIHASTAGLLIASFAFIIATLGPFLVLSSSKFNRKKILVISLLIFSIVSFLSAFVSNFNLLLLLRLFSALFHPIYFSLAMITAISLYPKEQSTKATAHAFIGTSMGMVLGIPITSWIANQASYEIAFIFCALINLFAAIGLITYLPDSMHQSQLTYRKQLSILYRPKLWLNIIASTFIFAAMFSVYAYAVEYLEQETNFQSKTVSLLLVIFGIGGVLGNLLAGQLLNKNRVTTTLFHPILLILAYVIFSFANQLNISSIVIFIFFWGAIHTSGLIITQIWLTSEAIDVPEFATGLYISFINLGVTIGAASSGWFIKLLGIHGIIFSGILFCSLAIIFIILRIMLKYKV